MGEEAAVKEPRGAMSEHQHRFAWENLHAYALDALDEEERRQVEAHLRECPLCQQELQSWQDTVGKLAYAVPFYEPPVYLRATIRNVVAVSPAKAADTPVLRAVRRRPTRSGELTTLLQRPYMFLTTLLILALGLVGWNVRLHRQMSTLRAEMSEVDEMRSVIVEYMNNPSAFEHFTLEGPNGARAHLLYSSATNRLTLITDGLPWLGEDVVYTLWFHDDTGRQVLATVFRCDRTGRAMVVFEPPFPLENVIEITIAPSRSTIPDSPVLNGRLKRHEGSPAIFVSSAL